jgi:hypothetical protein
MTNSEKTRDKWLQPFDSKSIWNMPIGSDAEYTPANIGKAGWVGVDQELFYRLKSDDPLQAVYAPGSWTERSQPGGQYQGDANYWVCEQGVEQEFAKTYGYGMSESSGLFYEDSNQLFQALNVVTNNNSDSIGGGGIPLQPLAPPLA